MRVDDGRPSAAARFPLGLAVADMYTDLRVNPLLRRLLAHSRELLGTVAGSISLVDATRGRYDKIAEHGSACRLGRSFPLDEGATGEAVAWRMPVVIHDYRDVRGAHLPPGHPASHGAACRLGRSFPLDEGATGQAVARRIGRTAAVVHALDHGWLADLPDENASAHR